jgi:hypothetical protein
MDRTTYAREYARRRRDQQWEQDAMRAARCPRWLARGKRCNTLLKSRFVDGETKPWCPTCDCKSRGVCIDCRKAPVDGQPRKALRCALCKKIERQDATRRWVENNPGALKKSWQRRKKRLHADPTQRAQELERKKLWRHARPEKVREQKRAYAERNREKLLAYHADYRKRKAAEIAERERARYYAKHPERPSPTCRVCGVAVPYDGVGRPAVACLEHTANPRRRRSVVDSQEDGPSALSPRRCLHCPAVMSGRARICDACRRRRRADARERLASFHASAAPTVRAEA